MSPMPPCWPKGLPNWRAVKKKLPIKDSSHKISLDQKWLACSKGVTDTTNLTSLVFVPAFLSLEPIARRGKGMETHLLPVLAQIATTLLVVFLSLALFAERPACVQRRGRPGRQCKSKSRSP